MNNKRRNKSATAIHGGESNLSEDKAFKLSELLCKKEDELNKARATLEAIREERDQLRRKVHKLLDDNARLKEEKENAEYGTSLKGSTSNLAISRKAEKVKVKKTENRKSEIFLPENSLHGSAINPEKLSSSTAELLAQPVSNSSRFHEILHSRPITGHGTHSDDLSELKDRFRIELEKLQSRIDHLKSENRILQLSLHESKTKTEQFQMQLAKHESNDIALHMSLFYSEMIGETYDAILTLIEKKTANTHQMLQETISKCNQKEKERISAFTSCVQHALNPDFPDVQFRPSFNSFLEEHETNSASIKEMNAWSLPNLLKNLQKIKTRKNAIKHTITDLSSFTIESLHPPSSTTHATEPLVDLENAVLLNELTSVKRELAELKGNHFSAFQSKSKSDLRSGLEYENYSGSTTQSEDCTWILSQKLSGEKDFAKPQKCSKFLSLADLRIGTMTESEIGTELSQALKREEKLKKEVEKINFTLQQVQHNSELRHQKSANVLKTLKSSYGVLLDNSTKEKKRNVKTIEYLQQQIRFMEAVHSKEIEELKRKIMIFEREEENARLPENETAL